MGRACCWRRPGGVEIGTDNAGFIPLSAFRDRVEALPTFSLPIRLGGAGFNFRFADNRSKTRLTAADLSRALASRSHGGIRSKLRGTVVGPSANRRWRQAAAFYANNSWARINCCATLTPFGH